MECIIYYIIYNYISIYISTLFEFLISLNINQIFLKTFKYIKYNNNEKSL